MILQMSSFGEVLISRPAGREAFLGASAYIFNTFERENELILDFDNVKVLAPSWADEFIFAVRKNITSNISYIHTDNPSVSASLEVVAAENYQCLLPLYKGLLKNYSKNENE